MASSDPPQTPPTTARGRIEALRLYLRGVLDRVDTPFGRLVNFAIITSILLLCAVFVARTYSLPPKVDLWLERLEWGVTALFIVEYLLRVWIAEDRLGYIFSLYSAIDLVAILPFFFAGSGLQPVRIFRVLRIMRLIRFLDDPHFFFGTLRRGQLIVLRIVFTLVCIIFVSASLVYQAEHTGNPEHFRTFFDGLYFAVVTLTTVGFGDITPKSDFGRVVTLGVILSGILFLPWQVKQLIESWLASMRHRAGNCTSCGLKGHDGDAVFCKRCGARLPSEAEDRSGAHDRASR